MLFQMQFYVDPATGRKFYSKAQVVKYLEEAKSETIPEVAITSVDNVCPIYTSISFLEFFLTNDNNNIYLWIALFLYFIQLLAILCVQVVNKANESKANESLDWLPDGWIIEERTRNSGNSAGSKFKV